jgi:hypothetical protein
MTYIPFFDSEPLDVVLHSHHQYRQFRARLRMQLCQMPADTQKSWFRVLFPVFISLCAVVFFLSQLGYFALQKTSVLQEPSSLSSEQATQKPFSLLNPFTTDVYAVEQQVWQEHKNEMYWQTIELTTNRSVYDQFKKIAINAAFSDGIPQPDALVSLPDDTMTHLSIDRFVDQNGNQNIKKQGKTAITVIVDRTTEAPTFLLYHENSFNNPVEPRYVKPVLKREQERIQCNMTWASGENENSAEHKYDQLVKNVHLATGNLQIGYTDFDYVGLESYLTQNESVGALTLPYAQLAAILKNADPDLVKKSPDSGLDGSAVMQFTLTQTRKSILFAGIEKFASLSDDEFFAAYPHEVHEIYIDAKTFDLKKVETYFVLGSQKILFKTVRVTQSSFIPQNSAAMHSVPDDFVRYSGPQFLGSGCFYLEKKMNPKIYELLVWSNQKRAEINDRVKNPMLPEYSDDKVYKDGYAAVLQQVKDTLMEYQKQKILTDDEWLKAGYLFGTVDDPLQPRWF